jgi:hypothetical protein
MERHDVHPRRFVIDDGAPSSTCPMTDPIPLPGTIASGQTSADMHTLPSAHAPVGQAAGERLKHRRIGSPDPVR